MVVVQCQMDSGTYIANFNFHKDLAVGVEVGIALVVVDCVVVGFAVLFDELDGFDDVRLSLEEQP